MCCSARAIAELKKPAGRACRDCRIGGGRPIYANRPQICRDCACEWLARRDLARHLRPHLVAVAKSARTMVAKASLVSWRIFASGAWGPSV